MKEATSDSQKPDVRQFLPWLIAMGADEIMLDQPVNRFQAQDPVPQPAPTPPPKMTAQRAESAAPPVPTRSLGSTSQSLDDMLQAAMLLAASAQSLDELRAAVARFETHPLKKSATQAAFCDGPERARVLVLCDKPRNEEDKSGQVLAGKNQALAERMLAAIGLRAYDEAPTREAVTLANFIPWRPAGNRAVSQLEAKLCVPLARRLVELVKPQAILCFGSLPAQYLAGGDPSFMRQRGKWLNLDGIPLLTTYHPDTLLTAQQSKRLAWADLQAFRMRLDHP